VLVVAVLPGLVLPPLVCGLPLRELLRWLRRDRALLHQRDLGMARARLKRKWRLAMKRKMWKLKCKRVRLKVVLRV
jgi:hypothetical protein